MHGCTVTKLAFTVLMNVVEKPERNQFFGRTILTGNERCCETVLGAVARRFKCSTERYRFAVDLLTPPPARPAKPVLDHRRQRSGDNCTIATPAATTSRLQPILDSSGPRRAPRLAVDLGLLRRKMAMSSPPSRVSDLPLRPTKEVGSHVPPYDADLNSSSSGLTNDRRPGSLNDFHFHRAQSHYDRAAPRRAELSRRPRPPAGLGHPQ